MGYSKLTIQQMIADIEASKVYLPALQRKFVWGQDKITLLFDSLMRNYPFGTFLFWRLQPSQADIYVFYEFLKEYDERYPFNRRKTGVFINEIIGVLDGQQRLSSMYIGLMGTHTERTPYARIKNPDSYVKTNMYLNLLSLPYAIDSEDDISAKEEKDFEFRFLSADFVSKSATRKHISLDGSASTNEPVLWMKVGLVLGWKKEPDFEKILKDIKNYAQSDAQKAAFESQIRLIRHGLVTLHKRVQSDELVNYFQVEKNDLEDILKIFVRVNSGGTVLSKTDLLFSTIVATWDDGREQIEGLLKSINEKGDGFNFGSEYLMRCCLVLTDCPVLYKVNSFRSENVRKIQDEWPYIAEAIKKTVTLLVEFGFSGSLLTSSNSTIIIAYYLYKGGDVADASKIGIKKYLIHALLNGIYGASQEQLITSLRNAFRTELSTEHGTTTYEGRYKSFSFDEILKVKLPLQKSLAVTEDDINRFLEYSKGPASFFVLSLLYPNLRYNDVAFHQDHIHPASRFSTTEFEAMKISKEERQEWVGLRDSVPNLQLMEGRQNQIKSNSSLIDWLKSKDDTSQKEFMCNNFFPADVSLDFKCFKDFHKKRKEVLKINLLKILSITNKTSVEEENTSNDLSYF